MKRCVQCGHPVEKLYIQYSPENTRLVKCAACKSTADEYIECELMILLLDLLLHRPQIYRHLLFNLAIPTFSLFRFSLLFLLLDAYKFWVLGRDQSLSIQDGVFRVVGCVILGNLGFLGIFVGFSRNLLKFVDGFCGYREILMGVLVSSYFKVFMVGMMVWEFPVFVVYIVDLFVISSNLVALRVICESSLWKCMWACFSAHAIKSFVTWVLCS